MDGFRQFFSPNNQIGQAIAHKLPPSVSASNGHSVQSLPQHGGVVRPSTTNTPTIQHSITPVQPSTGNFQQSQFTPATQLDKPKLDDKTMYLLIGGVLVIGFLLSKK